MVNEGRSWALVWVFLSVNELTKERSCWGESRYLGSLARWFPGTWSPVSRHLHKDSSPWGGRHESTSILPSKQQGPTKSYFKMSPHVQKTLHDLIPQIWPFPWLPVAGGRYHPPIHHTKTPPLARCESAPPIFSFYPSSSRGAMMLCKSASGTSDPEEYLDSKCKKD